MQSSAPAGGASGRPTSQCLQHIDFKREKKSTIYLKFQNVLVISSKTASRAQPRTWTNWELAASPWGEENSSVSRVYTCGYRRVLRNTPQEQQHDRREKHRAFTAALLLTDKLQTADVSKRRAWPAARDGDEPGPGPRWGTARTADLFLWAPSGLGFRVPSYESLSIYPLWVPFFFFCYILFWLERVNVHDPTCSSVDFCLYYLSFRGFPQNHHFHLYLSMVYSDTVSSVSVI